MSEYDNMRDLLKLVRLAEKQIINEDLSREVTPEEYAQEIEKFKKAVSPAVEFSQDSRNFKMYEDYVEWNGVLLREQIAFTYTTENTDGIYLSSLNQVQLTESCFQIISKLSAYYRTWSDYWTSQLGGVPASPDANSEQPAPQQQAPAPQPKQGGENGQI